EIVRPGPPPTPTAGPSAQSAAPPRAPRPAEAPRFPLQLPAGLEQVLPLNKARSYHGDGIRVVHCPAEKERQYGSCGNLLFGGLAMFGSHLRGTLRFRFAPPAKGVSRFEIDWGDGLAGDDGVLAAPQFFRLPVRGVRVGHWPGTVLAGDLDLATGEATNLDV